MTTYNKYHEWLNLKPGTTAKEMLEQVSHPSAYEGIIFKHRGQKMIVCQVGYALYTLVTPTGNRFYDPIELEDDEANKIFGPNPERYTYHGLLHEALND